VGKIEMERDTCVINYSTQIVGDMYLMRIRYVFNTGNVIDNVNGDVYEKPCLYNMLDYCKQEEKLNRSISNLKREVVAELMHRGADRQSALRTAYEMLQR